MASLFGRKVSLLDAIAGSIAVAALAGVVWSPKLNNQLAKATGSVKAVQVQVDARNLPLADPTAFLQSARDDQSLSLIVRNQPAGRVQVLAIDEVRRRLVELQPNGQVIQDDDPTSPLLHHVRFNLEAQATIGPSGIVFGGTKLKIGSPVELEGTLYRVNGTVSGVVLP
ncbi:DUF4330 domain-containing protein [Parasynechococcus sp.]|uniref:DUF4330 domain-containing protein n=1 Tax=Parasynechococcus sp. TaxID=3101203 RepID=UPI003704C014